MKNDKNQPNPPTLVAYAVRDRGEGKKAIWIRIGAAWAHADSKGFNIQLDVVPLDGRVNLRTPVEPGDA
ncbi:MAG: hypothetical protein KJ057_16290 [Phycisphaerae bacterium]|nr:MAG: hypothetical protein EDS66_14815 [Planctomycetota bacterium]MBE7457318.1 hypothetical protein [Planctomycetia bacterium]MCL4720028.1 hypothetical protein [Phycisphaerae bacterium]